MSVSIVPAPGGYRLETSCRLNAPLDVVFPFFASAANLERITPPRLRFKILTEGPLEMREGLLIDYRITLGIVPMRWRTEITAWEPPFRFVDTQLRGPYRTWVHEHRFEPDGDGTVCTDVVDYAVPGGAPVHALLVRRDLQNIFAYRESAMKSIFAQPPAIAQSA